MLLRWSLGQAEAANAVELAVSAALDEGFRTGDIWPRSAAAADSCTRVGTVGMADAIVARIGPGRARPADSRPADDLDIGTTVATAQLLGML